MPAGTGGKQLNGTTNKLSESMCSALYQASLECLDKNGYEREKCAEAFSKYRECKAEEFRSMRQQRIDERKQRGSFF
ncbi:hypothetical protein WJX81_002931 [Elliptochloris bilobata]|uniref:CHCH domain-containing protein n=1 Tax=Elliptochloris bilobata TaxID=381761 RepID=A0AAW1S7I4_9CHLO